MTIEEKRITHAEEHQRGYEGSLVVCELLDCPEAFIKRNAGESC